MNGATSACGITNAYSYFKLACKLANWSSHASYGEQLTMYMSRSDLHVFCHQIHQSVAKRLGIKDVEWKCTQELADEIQQQNPQTATKMEEFLKAFEDWFLLHEQIEASRSSGNLSTDQKTKLMNAIAYRDSTRRSLLDNLPKA